jgi:hypothetical protein
MLELEVFVFELLPVDALTTGSIARGKVTTLNHERLDDTVELGSLIEQGLSLLANTLLTGTESSEVLRSLGRDVRVEFHDHASNWRLADGNVEEDAWTSYEKISVLSKVAVVG